MRARRHHALGEGEHDHKGEQGDGHALLGHGAHGDKSETLFWGLVLYTISTMFGASSSIVVKLLGGSGGMSAMQLVFVRSCVLMLCSLPTLRHPAARQLIAERHDLLALRGVLGFMSVAFMYIAVRLLPLSDAVALAFLAPLLVAALSPLLLQERPPRIVLLALGLAAAGALLVARPSSLSGLLPGLGPAAAGSAGPSRAGVAAALAHAVSAAGARITVRSLGLHSTSAAVTSAIVLSAGLVSAAGSGTVLLAQGGFSAPASGTAWALLGGVGLAGYLHQATMTAGLQRVPVSTTSSLTYLSIAWSMLADWLVFAQPPARTSMAGAGLICSGGLLLTAWRLRHGFGGGGKAAGHKGEAQPSMPLRG